MSATSMSTGNAALTNRNDFAFTASKVEFPSCGTTLRGLLLIPEDGKASRPAIVMAPGMSGVKEGSIYKFAEFFARGGFATLAYDNINFGDSGGEPRQEVDPHMQRRGFRDAITFIGLRPEADKQSIGIWGTSFAGGNVLEVAAHDRRVKCVVSQIPHISGPRNFRRRVQPLMRPGALAVQDADREARFQGKPPAMIKAVSDNPAEPCAMAGLPAFDYFMEQARIAPNWRNQLTLRSIDHVRGIENSAFVPYISPTPLMMIVALDDELAPSDFALQAYASAQEPKALVLLPGNHFCPYQEEFEVTSHAARDWFTRHLMVRGSAALNA